MGQEFFFFFFLNYNGTRAVGTWRIVGRWQLFRWPSCGVWPLSVALLNLLDGAFLRFAANFTSGQSIGKERDVCVMVKFRLKLY